MGGRRRGWATALLAGATGLTGVGSVLWFTALPAAAFTAPVDVVGRSFNPRTTRIEVDDKVLWRNRSDEKHTITSDSDTPGTGFDYTLGKEGATEERRFERPGVYTYHCKFHPQMTGTVEVVDPDAPTTTTAPPTTTTTAPPTTTSTEPPTTTSAPATTQPPPTTTTAPSRPPASVPQPRPPATAAAPPPTLATSSTTTMPPTTTTTVPPTTASSAPPPVTTDTAAPPEAPPSTEAAPMPDQGPGEDDQVAAGRSEAGGDGLDPSAVVLISLLVAVGLFGTWSLIRVRPGRI